MGDKHPLTSSEQYQLTDVGDSRTDLNTPPEMEDDEFREGKPSIFSPYNINGRMIVMAIALICFLFSLMLFIGTVVVFFTRPDSHSGCSLDAFSAKVQEQKAIAASQGKLAFNERHEKNYPLHSEGTDKQDQSSTSVFDPNAKSVTKVNGKHVPPGQLVYGEEFNDFNTTVWEHVLHESASFFHFYVNNRSNSYVHDGKLFLKPTYTADVYGEAFVTNGHLFLGRIPSEKCKNISALCWKTASGIVHPIMSPMVITKEHFNFQYGRLEIRAKMPAGDWIEPLISLQPETNLYGEGLLSGQVHLIDTRGNRKLMNTDGVNVGSEQTCPDIRFGNHREKKIVYDCLSTHPHQGFDIDFHVYEVLWTPEGITIKIDGEGLVTAPGPRPSMYKLWSKGRDVKNPWGQSNNEKMAPFDTSFYLALGINVGGTNGFFHDDFEGPYPKPWKNDDPQAAKTFWEGRNNWEPTWEGENSALQIDYVRLWSLNTTTSN